MKNGLRGFTLIELMVVISIISMLSSIMISSLAGAKDRARVGASYQFASSVDNALGGAPLGWWDFGDCSGNTLTDRSGNRFDGDLLDGGNNGGNKATWSTDIPYVNQTCSLVFDGTDKEVLVNTGQKSHTGSFTVSVWVKPAVSAVGSVMSIVGSRNGSLFNSFDLKLENGTSVHSDIGDGTNWLTTSALAPLKYQVGRWYHIVLVVKPSSYRIYTDGKVNVDNAMTAGTPLLYGGSGTPKNQLKIGSNGGTLVLPEHFNGSITYFHLFNEAITERQVEQIYALEKSRLDASTLVERD